MANPVKIKCAVSAIVNHDDTVSTITLKPSRPLPNFHPGQFLHLALDPFDPRGGFWPESRVFSIASLPSGPELIIAYAIKGAFTQRMREEIEVGKELWIKLPYGHFSLTPSPQQEEIILVAGGTGITPFIAFLLNEMRRPSRMKLKLVYGVKKPHLFLFTDILMRVVSNRNDFKLLSFSEELWYEKGHFPISEGSLALDKIWQAADDPTKATFYLSGPIVMISTFKEGLLGKGIKPENIRIDEWE